MNATLTKELEHAKVMLFSKNAPFISTIIFSLLYRESQDIPTAAVDGVTCYINPDFFTALTPEERIGLLAHEAWHVAFRHMTRATSIPKADHEKYNRAADYVINLLLTDASFKLPPEGLLDRKYTDMNTEQVYNLLPEPLKDSNFTLDIIPNDSPDNVAKEERDKLIEDILVQAAIQEQKVNKGYGALPGEIIRDIERILNPKLPWEVILQNYFNDKVKEDYSWAKPNRRYFPEFYLPSIEVEGITHISVAVDTSGSVTKDDFAAFLTEIHSIHTTFQPELLTVIDFDTTIKAEHQLTTSDDITQIPFRGCGGTDIAPIFEWYRKNTPEVLVIFTDGEFYMPHMKSEASILWVIYDNPYFTTKVGTVINFDRDNV